MSYPAPDGPITAVVQCCGTSPQTSSRSLRGGSVPFPALMFKYEQQYIRVGENHIC
jgi:hypothetical protein